MMVLVHQWLADLPAETTHLIVGLHGAGANFLQHSFCHRAKKIGTLSFPAQTEMLPVRPTAANARRLDPEDARRQSLETTIECSILCDGGVVLAVCHVSHRKPVTIALVMLTAGRTQGKIPAERAYSWSAALLQSVRSAW
jgi:hypothetical protein